MQTLEYALELAMSMIQALSAESLMESTSGFLLETRSLMHLHLLLRAHGLC